MPSSALPDEIEDVARRLSPHAVRAVSELRRGNNSRVFRVDTSAGSFALKKYPTSDDRDRLGAERAALHFFQRKGIGRTPRMVSAAADIRFALLTWLDGAPVEAVTDDDVAQFAAFQVALDEAVDAPARGAVGEASEACLSGRRIVAHITRRFARLDAVKHDVPSFPPFFEDVLLPALRRHEARARSVYDGLGLAFDDDIPWPMRTLIPSDMGTHNALRAGDGRLCFLDFEYFGWDDPLTSLANFVQHPGMVLSPWQRDAYRAALLRHFGSPHAAERLGALLPLYGLRWCAIILGELLPERWRHRLESNPDGRDWGTVCRAQIAKARVVAERYCAG